MVHIWSSNILLRANTAAMYATPLHGYLAHKKLPPLLGPPSGFTHRLIVGSQGGAFLMSEVPL